MVRLARVVLPGVVHCITQRGVRSIGIFSCNKDKSYYLELLKNASTEFDLTFLSYGLRSNPVHLLIIPEEEASLRLGIGAVHNPLDDKHLSSVLSYIVLNPVRSRYIQKSIGI